MRMPKRKRLDNYDPSRSMLNGENVCDELDSCNQHVLEEKTINSNSSVDFNNKESPLETVQINSDQNVTSESSPTTTTAENDGFKSPLPITTNDNSIRRKSNRILSLKRLNQNQNSPSLVTSSTSEDHQAQTSECTSNLLANNTDVNNNKPNQTSDVSSTLNPTTNSSNNQNKNSSTNGTTNASSTGKSLRKIQAWTEDDIRWFFEALCEHGKDFPHIQSYIASRCEKKGIPQDSIKNYEQVRHFYYRMWHKISQILKISPEVEKGIQEIYGLINYGEIWKKFGSKFDGKLNFNLQQLVDYGYTVVKMKGKSVRIRTPVCNALKKIHNINNKISKPVTQPPMPKEITIELIPATNTDWLHIHSMAQNPRLRTKLTLQQRLSTLIAYLERRWNMARIYQNEFLSLMGTDLDNNCNDDQSSSNNNNKRNNFYIRLRPQNSAKLCDKVTLKSTANSISYHNYRSTTHGTTQIDLSLSAYMKNMFNDGINLKKSKIRKSTSKKLVTTPVDQGAERKDSNEDVIINKDEQKDDNNETQEDTKESNEVDEPQPIDLFKLLDSMNEELEVPQNHHNKTSYSEWKNINSEVETNESIDTTTTDDLRNDQDDESRLPEPPAHQTLAQWLAGGDLIDNVEDEDVDNKQINEEIEVDQEDGGEESSKNIIDGDKINSLTSSQNKISDSIKTNITNKKRRASDDIGVETVEMLTAEKARQGWTLQDGKAVTIGELYLLFCQPNKIVLEYSWIVDHQRLPEEQIKEESKEEPKLTQKLLVDTNVEKPLSTLQKFLIAANLTLMNYKKSNSGNGLSSILNNSSSLTSSSNKTSRKRGGTSKNSNTPTANSQLLSNLIQETILNDNPTDKDEDTIINETNKSQTDSKTKLSKSSNGSGEEKTSSSTQITKCNQSMSSKAKNRTTTVLDDPHKIEEVLKELKIRGRQRRPFTKFMYNNPNKMINLNGTRPTVLLIRASNLSQAEGINSKQIVLTANMPQTSISLATSSPNSTFSSNNHNSSVSKNTSSVLIPVHLETKSISITKNPTSLTSDQNSPYLRMVPTTTTSTTDLSSIENNSVTLQLSKDESTNVQSGPYNNSGPNNVDIGQKNMTSSSSENETTFKSSSNELQSSHIPWFHNVNSHDNISLGALFTNCDNNTTGGNELGQKLTNDTSVSLAPLPNDIETHMNTFANDNSVDLMAKFADLAEQIISNDAKIIQ